MNTKTTGLGDIVAWAHDGAWQIGVVVGHQKRDFVTYVVTGMGRTAKPIGIRDTALTPIETISNILTHLPAPTEAP